MFFNQGRTRMDFYTPSVDANAIQNHNLTDDMNYFAYKLFENFQNPSRPQEYVSNAHCMQREKVDLERLQKAKETLTNYFYVILIMTVLGVYFERLRSICAGCVYPNRDEERNIWLYNHILEIRTMQASLKTEGTGSSVKFVLIWLWKNLTYISVDILFRTFCCSLCW